MRILHISSMYPFEADRTNGIFIRDLVNNLKVHGRNDYGVVVPRKIYRRDYSLSRNLRNLFPHQASNLSDPRYFRYIPALALHLSRGYDAFLADHFMKSKMDRYVISNKTDLLHAHTAIPDGYLAMRLSETRGIGYVAHAHGGELTISPHLDRKYKEVIRQVYSSADAIICNSKRTRRILLSVMESVERPIAVLPFGIEMSDEIEQKHEANGDSVKIVCVARLVKSKNIDLLIEAISRSKYLGRISLTIIGDGEQKEYLVDLTRKLGIDGHVHFLGYMDNGAMRSSLPGFDFFVLPAVDEGLGVVYLEALAAGLPSVGVKGEGCEDIAEKGECMLLAEPSDVRDLTDKIDSLIENPEIIEKMSVEAKKVIKQFYSWPTVVKDYEDFYSSIVTSA